MTMTLRNIVETRLAQLGIGPVEATKGTGLERTFIRDVATGKKRTVSHDKVLGLAKALQLDANGLLHNEMVPAGEEFSLVHHAPVPLLTAVSAGELLRDDIRDEAMGMLYFADLPEGDWIALRVEGTSMDRISPPESIIVVNRADKRLVPNACYVIADEDGAATYKRYRPSPDRFEPVSTFDHHKTIFPEHQPTIVGRVKRSYIDM